MYSSEDISSASRIAMAIEVKNKNGGLHIAQDVKEHVMERDNKKKVTVISVKNVKFQAMLKKSVGKHIPNCFEKNGEKNLISSSLFERLGLETTPHPQPYSLGWIKKDVDTQVNRQSAHWRYKESACKNSSFVLQMIEWARWVVMWQCENMGEYKACVDYNEAIKPPCTFPFHSEDCPHSYRHCSGSVGPVFVIMIENDKTSVQEFPANSTVKDVLNIAGHGSSSRYSPYGFYLKQELRPTLNHEPVSDPWVTRCQTRAGGGLLVARLVGGEDDVHSFIAMMTGLFEITIALVLSQNI
ncbi:hypothetical protein Tco_1288242, partial [Tanacetum coccineum]